MKDILDQLRSSGWLVGAHNDYRIGSVQHTFWLITHPTGGFLKEEGLTDMECLERLASRAREYELRRLRGYA